MALPLLTLTGNIHDTAGGIPVEPRRCIVSIVPCDADGVIQRIVDPESNEERYGNARAVVDPTTGNYTFTDLWPTNAATNPTGYYYEVFVEYVLARGSNKHRHNGRPTWRSGPFQLTASSAMADLDLDTPAVSAWWRSQFRDEMDDVRAATQAARNAAEAARDAAEALVISDLGTTDGQTRALIEASASQTAQALADAIAAVAEQTDFVAAAERFSPYRTIEVRKVVSTYGAGADPSVEVSAVDPDGKHVTYVFGNSGAGRYRILGEVFEGVTTPTYYPPSQGSGAAPTDDFGAYDFRTSQAVRAGAGWNTTATYYTTTVGDYFEAPATCRVDGGSLVVHLRTFKDNRGGIWRLSIGGQTGFGTKDVSTYGTNNAITVQDTVWTIPNVPAGDYKIRATFQGADPLNAPSGGTARGWMTSAAEPGYVIRLADLVPLRTKTRTLKAALSNQDIAVNWRPTSADTYRFFPHHGQGEEVENVITPPVFYDGTTVIDVDGMHIGQRRILTAGFEIVQRLRGRNVTAGPDYIQLTSKQRVRANGVLSMDVGARTLSPLEMSRAAYVMMLVVNPALFDKIVSSRGNPYGIDKVSHPDDTATDLVNESNRSIAYAAVSAANPDLFAAVRFNNPVQTLRANEADPDVVPVWIEHRTATVTKLYPRIGYDDEAAVPSGTVWRFSGDFFYGRLPGIAYVVAP